MWKTIFSIGKYTFGAIAVVGAGALVVTLTGVVAVASPLALAAVTLGSTVATGGCMIAEDLIKDKEDEKNEPNVDSEENERLRNKCNRLANQTTAQQKRIKKLQSEASAQATKINTLESTVKKLKVRDINQSQQLASMQRQIEVDRQTDQTDSEDDEIGANVRSVSFSM